MRVVTLFFFLLTISMPGQDADSSRVIPFNRADTEHCKITKASGRELLETNFGGTSVAISLPASMPDGEFEMYVSVRQIGTGPVEIKPQDFGAYYSDPSHTRFPYYDEAAEIERQEAGARAHASAPGNAGTGSRSGENLPGTPPPPGSLNSNAYTAVPRTVSGQDPNAAARQQEQQREDQEKISRLGQSIASDRLSELLKPGSIQQGGSVGGLVYFRKPKGFKMKSGQQGVLYQIDIPVNGTIFRFR